MPWDALDRYMLLQQAAGLLTPSAQAAHADEILSRCLLEEFPARQMKQTITSCLDRCAVATWHAVSGSE